MLCEDVAVIFGMKESPHPHQQLLIRTSLNLVADYRQPRMPLETSSVIGQSVYEYRFLRDADQTFARCGGSGREFSGLFVSFLAYHRVSGVGTLRTPLKRCRARDIACRYSGGLRGGMIPRTSDC